MIWHGIIIEIIGPAGYNKLVFAPNIIVLSIIYQRFVK